MQSGLILLFSSSKIILIFTRSPDSVSPSDPSIVPMRHITFHGKIPICSSWWVCESIFTFFYLSMDAPWGHWFHRKWFLSFHTHIQLSWGKGVSVLILSRCFWKIASSFFRKMRRDFEFSSCTPARLCRGTGVPARNFQSDGNAGPLLAKPEALAQGCILLSEVPVSQGLKEPFTSKLTFCMAMSVQRGCWGVCFFLKTEKEKQKHRMGWWFWLVMHRCLGPSPTFLKSFTIWFMAGLSKTTTIIILVILHLRFFLPCLLFQHLHWFHNLQTFLSLTSTACASSTFTPVSKLQKCLTLLGFPGHWPFFTLYPLFLPYSV